MKKIYRYIKNKRLYYRSLSNNLTVLWLPKLEKEEDLNREISRMVWYINPFYSKVKVIYFYVSSELNNNLDPFTSPQYVDSEIKNLYKKFKCKIIFLEDEDKKIKVDILVEWKKYDYRNSLFNRTSTFRVNGSVFNNQFEANQMVKISEAMLSTENYEQNLLNLKELLIDYQKKQYKHINLFGSGPSFNKYKEMDLTNSLSIVCNSIVKNIEFLKKVRPQLMIATDAVFHTGYSQYAGEFRKYLSYALDTIEEMFFIVPKRDLFLYQENLPSRFRNRILGIESKNIRNYNLNLIQRGVVKSTSNVLTLFLLPLASTIGSSIQILGFDGRSKNDSTQFWKYDDRSQFLDVIDSTRLAHPAFYKVNYNEYFEQHCKETELVVNQILKKGILIKSLAPSTILALSKIHD